MKYFKEKKKADMAVKLEDGFGRWMRQHDLEFTTERWQDACKESKIKFDRELVNRQSRAEMQTGCEKKSHWRAAVD
eukprot:10236710-Lingulodinium_polyedra.AAC.1